MKRFFGVLAVVALSLCAIGRVQGQTAGATPNLSALRPFLGSWACTRSKGPASMGGPGTKSSVTYSMTLEKAFLLGAVTIPPNTVMKKTVKALYYFSYDPTIKKWLWLAVDTTGGYDYATSDGPANGAWKWTESVATSAGLPIWHITVTRVNPTRYTSQYIGPDPKQHHVGESDDDCTKGA